MIPRQFQPNYSELFLPPDFFNYYHYSILIIIIIPFHLNYSNYSQLFPIIPNYSQLF